MAGNFKTPDYLEIKESLKEHLKSLDAFKDFDFDASGIQQILSLLAYNTAYNAFYLNMLGAEMFLDSAQLRSSVVSRAKNIGYTPGSAKGARAQVHLKVTPSGSESNNLPFISITQADSFQAAKDDKTYTFTPDKTYVLERTTSGTYEGLVNLIEGTRLSFSYVVDQTAPVKQRFVIPNENVDTNNLVVKVRESSAASGYKVFSRSTNINKNKADDLVYFLQEDENGFYEVIFGEDIVGVQPKTGNIVTIDYVATSGPAANDIKVFNKTDRVAGYSDVIIKTTSPAKLGQEKETLASIKLLAPLQYEAQDRAVTKNDYELLIRKDNTNVQFVRVWGGEEHQPPEYGVVFAAIKPKTGSRLSVQEKNSIIQRLLRDRNIVSMEVKIVDPDYLYLSLNSRVTFRSKQTTLRAEDIKSLVFNTILNFTAKSLNGFDADFTHSKLLAAIDGSDKSITGNITLVSLKKRVYPSFVEPSRIDLRFHNEIDKGDNRNDQSAVYSTPIVVSGVTTFLADDGKGALSLYRLVDNRRVVFQSNVGTVDYVTGRIVVPSIKIDAIKDSEFFEVFATPVNPDVLTPRETILLCEDSDISVSVQALDLKGEEA